MINRLISAFMLMCMFALVGTQLCYAEDTIPIGTSSFDDVVFSSPMPVYIVDEPLPEGDGIVTMAINDNPYLGTISTALYQYFKDLSATLPVGVDYVFYRADQYNYRLVYGKGITLNNGVFTGSSVNVINYYNYSSNDRNVISRYTDTSFRLNDNGAFIYSSLGEGYPKLYEGVTARDFKALFMFIVICVLTNLVLRILSR